MKLKVGDRVKRIAIGDKIPIGTLGTITHVSYNGSYYTVDFDNGINNFDADPDSIELYKEEFKVGDIIVITDNSAFIKHGNHHITVGIEGTITKISSTSKVMEANINGSVYGVTKDIIRLKSNSISSSPKLPPPKQCNNCPNTNDYGAPANRPNNIFVCGSCRSFGF